MNSLFPLNDEPKPMHWRGTAASWFGWRRWLIVKGALAHWRWLWLQRYKVPARILSILIESSEKKYNWPAACQVLSNIFYVLTCLVLYSDCCSDFGERSGRYILWLQAITRTCHLLSEVFSSSDIPCHFYRRTNITLYASPLNQPCTCLCWIRYQYWGNFITG